MQIIDLLNLTLDEQIDYIRSLSASEQSTLLPIMRKVHKLRNEPNLQVNKEWLELMFTWIPEARI